jgi:hypothetical protein
MKKLILACSLLLFTSFTYCQDIKKGNLVGIHIFEAKLAPGVTIEQFVAAYNSKMIPVAEKVFPGWNIYPIKRVRGDKSPSFGVMIVVPSDQETRKYYNADDTPTALGKPAVEKLNEAIKGLSKLGTMPTSMPYMGI